MKRISRNKFRKFDVRTPSTRNSAKRDISHARHWRQSHQRLVNIVPGEWHRSSNSTTFRATKKATRGNKVGWLKRGLFSPRGYGALSRIFQMKFVHRGHQILSIR